MKLSTYTFFALVVSALTLSNSAIALYRVNPIGGPVAGSNPSGGATPTGAVYSGISTQGNSAVNQQYLYDRAVRTGQSTLETSQAFDAVRNSGVPVRDFTSGSVGMDSILSRNPDLYRTAPMAIEDRRDLSTANPYVKLAPQ